MPTKILLNSTLSLAILLAGCGRKERSGHSEESYTTSIPDVVVSETVEEKNERERLEKEQESLRKEYERILEIRSKDPNLNWINIGITTGKFSESISSSVFKTYEECVNAGYMEDHTCSPITALPKSYWDAEKK